ncbi:MAG: hypothetical protein HYZ84_04295 [Candidatus Omnitrophica bacterium]|nr:hypothetical protein [Candidatus Omnitrophota bacterium]
MKRESMVLFVALASGIAAFGMIFNFLKEAKRPASSYIMTLKDVKKGQIIKKEDLGMSDPLKNIPAQAYYTQASDVIDKTALDDIAKGKLIARSMVKAIEKPATPAPLPEQKRVKKQPRTIPVPASMRAITLTIQELQNPPASIEPGNHVDILSTIGRNEVKTILNSVLIVGVARSENDNIESVTFALTPEEVEKLLSFSKSGRMRLILSSSGGNDASAVDFVEIIRGVQREKKIT